jgi:hypothetical protein
MYLFTRPVLNLIKQIVLASAALLIVVSKDPSVIGVEGGGRWELQSSLIENNDDYTMNRINVS